MLRSFIVRIDAVIDCQNHVVFTNTRLDLPDLSFAWWFGSSADPGRGEYCTRRPLQVEWSAVIVYPVFVEFVLVSEWSLYDQVALARMVNLLMNRWGSIHCHLRAVFFKLSFKKEFFVRWVILLFLSSLKWANPHTQMSDSEENEGRCSASKHFLDWCNADNKPNCGTALFSCIWLIFCSFK